MEPSLVENFAKNTNRILGILIDSASVKRKTKIFPFASIGASQIFPEFNFLGN